MLSDVDRQLYLLMLRIDPADILSTGWLLLAPPLATAALQVCCAPYACASWSWISQGRAQRGSCLPAADKTLRSAVCSDRNAGAAGCGVLCQLEKFQCQLADH